MLIVPSRHTKSLELRKHGELVAYVFYRIFGGEFDGAEIHDPVVDNFIFIPADQFSDLQKQTYQEKISEYLEARKGAPKEFNNDDDGPFAA